MGKKSKGPQRDPYLTIDECANVIRLIQESSIVNSEACPSQDAAIGFYILMDWIGDSLEHHAEGK